MAHLLVVDDEPSARSTLALLLRKRGHRVLEADGLASATARLSDEVFDLVVTDLRMPDGDGLDVLRAAKAHAPATEVILLTAYAEWKSAKEAIRLGALDYFEKGQEPEELFRRIDIALAGRALRRENENLRAQLRERYGLPGLIAQSPAMHAVLDALIGQGTFREDLFYRLNVIQILLPPLRDRREDIPALAEHILARAAGKLGRRLRLSPEGLERLLRYPWPGNVRELENAIERAAILARGDAVEPDDLPPHVSAGIQLGPSPALPRQISLAEAERAHILQTLERFGRNHSGAAEAP